MTTKLDLVMAAVFLAACDTGFGQPTIQFSKTSYSVAEDAGTLSLTVLRLNDSSGAVTVDYATVDGTATAGLDYVATNGTLVFAQARRPPCSRYRSSTTV